MCTVVKFQSAALWIEVVWDEPQHLKMLQLEGRSLKHLLVQPFHFIVEEPDLFKCINQKHKTGCSEVKNVSRDIWKLLQNVVTLAQTSLLGGRWLFLGCPFWTMGLDPVGDKSVAERRCLVILNYSAWQASSLNRNLNRRLGVVP